jgi:hypothetical protein
MGFQQPLPMRPGFGIRAVQSLRRESRELVCLEKIYVAALKRLAHVTREVENGQVLADETANAD